MYNKLFLFLVMLLITTNLYSRIIYIPDKYKSIQQGINASSDGDTILVKPGTYFENINPKGKSITVSSFYFLKNDSSYIFNTVINGSKSRHSDSVSVVYMISGEDSNSVISGFTIEGGRGTDISQTLGFPARAGGAILAFSGGSVTNCIIRNNNISKFSNCAGGAVFAGYDGNGSINLKENLIYNNTLDAYKQAVGGGIALFKINANIQKNIISNNWVTIKGNNTTNIVGGGIFCESLPPKINTVRIEANEIKNISIAGDADNFASYGAGIASWFTKVIIKNNSIHTNSIYNTCSSFGVGIALTYCGSGSLIENNSIDNNVIRSQSFGYGALSIVYSESIEIQRNNIFNNNMRNGGGIFIFESTDIQINANRIWLNTAANNGGGIYSIDSNPFISNNIIENNTSIKGAGINFYSNSAKSSNIFANLFNTNKSFCGVKNNHFLSKSGYTSPVIINNTIIENIAELYGGGIFANSVSPIVINTILWSNTAPEGNQLYNYNGNSQLRYTDVQDSLWPGSGNINTNPFFNDSLYNLSDSSLCIGAGFDSLEIDGIWYFAPRYDFDGDKRPMPVNLAPDIGAQEHLLATPNSVQSNDHSITHKFMLTQNYPNPFNPKTTIEFSITKPEFVTLKIYNVLGQEVMTLISDNLKAGNHKYVWNAHTFASGVYYYKLETENFSQMKKMILIK